MRTLTGPPSTEPVMSHEEAELDPVELVCLGSDDLAAPVKTLVLFRLLLYALHVNLSGGRAMNSLTKN